MPSGRGRLDSSDLGATCRQPAFGLVIRRSRARLPRGVRTTVRRALVRRILYQDEARLEYGRRFWRDPSKRSRLLRHWLDPRHPYHERFRSQWMPWVERVLCSDAADDDRLDRELQERGLSLRVVVKEIPPVFGGFFEIG
jgi:hypothetical protein